MKKANYLILHLAYYCLLHCSAFSQKWADSIEVYGREVYMPAEKYKWDWGQATFLNSLVHLYNVKPPAKKKNTWHI